MSGDTVAVFNGKTMTRREVGIAREAYATALRSHGWMPESAYRVAIATYPLPAITRPRVVQDHTGPSGLVEWRVVDGCLEWRRGPANPWKRGDYNNSGMYINAERVKMLADLLADPNETVEE